MLDGRLRENIKPGAIVKIEENKNRGTGVLSEGIIKEILTELKSHPQGILVELESGLVGRVKEIVDSKITATRAALPIALAEKHREGQRLEYKSSFRFDWKRFRMTNEKKVNDQIEMAISKTIAAFANSEGGKLYIGVDDNEDNQILGLSEDYALLNKPGSDGFELELKGSVKKYLGNPCILNHIRCNFHKIDGKEICEVIVMPSPRAVVLHDGKRPIFYLRTGNSSEEFAPDEFIEYWVRRMGLLSHGEYGRE
jgi:uncharacterized repeat protein (TIGR03833 family)